MAIANGMTVQFNGEVPASRIHELGIEMSKVKQLYGKQIKLCKFTQNSSRVLDDGRVMIKGIGYFPKEIFKEVAEVEEENDVYCIIIMTKDCEGAYMHYDDVVDHFQNELGIYIFCDSGDEHFHPWSFEGGIQRVTKRSEYYS